MTTQTFPTEIRIDLELRVSYPGEPGELASVIRLMRASGGQLQAHLTYRLYDKAAAFFLCECPAEAALALRKEGFEVETETVVTVRTCDRPGLLNHLVESLEADNVDVSYSYATAAGDMVLLVIRTNNNPKAEDVLRTYLLPAVGV